MQHAQFHHEPVSMDPRKVLRSTMYGPARVPGDYILEALKHEIEEYRLSSYQTFDIHVQVFPDRCSAQQHGDQGEWVGYSAYQFVQWSRPTVTHDVLVSTSGRPLVRWAGKWRSVWCWLETLKPPATGFERPVSRDAEWIQGLQQEMWAHQFRWWMANGKSFPLLRLPAEIREHIYGDVFGESIKPYPSAPARRISPLAQMGLAKKMNFNLLLTCKQVNHEASETLFSSIPFFVDHYTILRDVTDHTYLRARLRHLTIGFDHEQYVNLFRTSIIANLTHAGVNKLPAAEAFKYMALDSLRLVFNSPSDPGKGGKFARACQVNFVDYIMKMAWPFVRGQKVELKGCVKTRQVDAYEAKYQAVRDGFKMWKEYRRVDGKSEGKLVEYLQALDKADDDNDTVNGGGGVLLDEGQSKEGEAGPSSALAPGGAPPDLTCQCKVRCNSKNWSNLD